MSTIGIISTYASGVDVAFEWKIENFFNLPERDCYFSSLFSFGGEEWFLVIYPNDSSRNASYGHVDLGLCKYLSHRSMKQSFSLSLKTAKGEKYNEQHVTKDFDNLNRLHEFNRFIPRSELSRRRSNLTPDGTLTMICTMKSSTSARSASEAFASGSSINSHEKKVLHDLKELFLNKEDSDVTIKVEGSEFPAHRAILKVRSPVFASTFRHDMKENTTGILEIEDCSPSCFSGFLCFLYCGDVGIISQENVFGLFTLADKYQVLDLKSECLEFIKKNLTVATFCETITLALRHSETDLIKLSTNYFKNNVSKIIVTVKWQTFLAENPTEGNELFVKYFLPNSS